MAFAQYPDTFRRQDRRARIEGIYQSTARKDSIRRVLKLDRDGGAEITTEVRRDGDRRRDGRNDRNGWDKDDTRRFGRLAEEATFGRSLRHTGRWALRDGNVVIRMEDLSPDVRVRPRIDIVLFRRDGNLILDRNNDLYGIEKITFRPDGGWDGGRFGPAFRAPRFGSVLYDQSDLNVDSVELIERGADSRLVIRADNRRIELRGEVRRRGDEVRFTWPDRDREGGDITLQMRGGVVESIRGSGSQDRHRIVFRPMMRRD